MIVNDTNVKINDVIEEMKVVYKNDNRPWIIGYSGGKDSTVVVQLAFTMLESLAPEERTKPIYIVSSDTLIENPIVLGYLKDASNLINIGAKTKKLPLYAEMVHPDYDNSYWTNIIGKGLPTPTSIRFRWCTERLKIKPSNTFIENKVKENGEVIVLLGVRKAESIARKTRIENRQIDGYLLTPHGSLQNTYVYNPIVDFTTDDVWKTLLSNNGRNPWGGDNNELFALYAGSDAGECPFTITKNEKGEVDSPSCGNSRFGCWICTVVNEDKSLTGFIKNGEDWLQPLLDFREWLLSIRDKHEYRQQYRRDGNHYYKKLYLEDIPLSDDLMLDKSHIFVDEENNEYIVDKDTRPYINVVGYGPFNFYGRQEILKKLLKTQNIMKQYVDFDLITIEELEQIDKIWDNEEDLTRRKLVDIYYEITGKKLPWHDFKKPIFDDTTLATIKEFNSKFNLSDHLINKLLIETNKSKHYTNKTVLDKSISKVLNQKYLHKSIIEEIENDY